MRDEDEKQAILHEIRMVINPSVRLQMASPYTSDLCKAINAKLRAYDDYGSTYFATHRREILTGTDVVTISQLSYQMDDGGTSFNLRDLSTRSILYDVTEVMRRDLDLIVDQTVNLLNSPE